MTGLIPQHFIDDLLDRLDIVDVIDSRVKLKKSGKNYSACCPFHDEKTPSFTVSPEKQFFYCFGCGASGNTLGFIMDYERISFPEAVESLARLAGLEVPREVQTEAQQKREEEKRSIYTLLEKADAYYQLQLRTHPSKHLAVDYLRKRGLDGKIAKSFGIGFAPPGWDNLLKALARTDEDKHLLIEGGMLLHQEQEKKLYDRFRHRIMFPIRDTRGRVIGFGGRVLGDDKPKYLNSPETPIFHKGQELYGLYEARLAYRELPRLLVVEGYMDVVSLAQFGIAYGVATLGTACGPDHLQKAFKYTNEVVFCFDGDKAGRAAAQRALDAAIENMGDGRTVKFLFLPENEDPDTLIRQIGAEKFERLVELAVPFEDYLFDSVADGLNLRTLEGRATFSKRAAPLLARLPKSVFRELMFDSLAKRTGLTRAVLQDLALEQQAKQGSESRSPTLTGQSTSTPIYSGHPSSYRNHQIEKSDAPPAGIPPANLSPPDFSSQDFSSQDFSLPDLPPADYREYFYSPVRRNRINNYQPELQRRSTAKYLMPPARKALALLLAHPFLATIEPDHDQWLAITDDPDCLLLGQLLKVMHERPHYNLPHILGHWRGAFGNADAERLAAIAGHDLLQAADALTKPRADKPAKANYDPEAAFIDTINKLRALQDLRQSNASLNKLKSCDPNQLSKEEKEELVQAALRAKWPRAPDP